MTALSFAVPGRLEAHEPPEATGRPRDCVRLMVASRADGRIGHARFRDLPLHLRRGDLLVVNTCATLPAAGAARRADGTPIEVHVSTAAPEDPREERWIVVLCDGSGPLFDGDAGERIALPGGAAFELLAPAGPSPRLWLARLRADAPLLAVLARHGHPIHDGCVPEPWPLAAYQTAFAAEAGARRCRAAGAPSRPSWSPASSPPATSSSHPSAACAPSTR